MPDGSDRDDAAGRSTRRSVLKTGTLASLSVGVGASAVATASAQEEGESDDTEFGDGDNVGKEEWFTEQEAHTALIYRDQWTPNGVFAIASPIVEFAPDAPEIPDSVWNGYDTRILRYLGTSEHVLFFPEEGASIGPYEEEFGYVVDDDFVEGDEVVVDGSAIDDRGGVDRRELEGIRPTICIYSRESTLVSGDNYVLETRFSPIPERAEERVWNQVSDAFGY